MTMQRDGLKMGKRPARRVSAGRVTFAALALIVAAFAAAPAQAGLLDLEVPKLPPLPLPSLPAVPSLPALPDLLEVPVSGSVNDVITTVNSIPEGLGGIVSGPSKPVKPVVKPPSIKRVPTIVDGWSLDRLPALTRSVTSNVPPTTVSSSRLGRPGSYTSLVGDGFRAAAGRAARLAGPLAAPLLVALFALATLVLAARGPGRLVKVEEDRQGFRDRRSYKL